MVYRIALCDDEPLIRTHLRRMLEVYSYQKNVDFEFIDMDSTGKLHQYDFDILFLDVRFNDVDIGIDAALALRENGYTGLIIFLTSYMDYSIKGYQAEGFRYLVKPVSEKELTDAMNAAITKLTSPKETLHIQVERGIVAITMDELISIESTARQRRILSEYDELYTWEPLQALYSKLPPDAFAYPHRSFIVHFKYVSQAKNMILRLRNGIEIPMGRKFRAPFMDSFNRYIDNHY